MTSHVVAALLTVIACSCGLTSGVFVQKSYDLSGDAPVELYADIHRLMVLGHHAAVVEAVDGVLASGVSDVCPPGFPVSTLSFMKGMALYGMGRIKPAQEAFAESILKGVRALAQR